MKKLYLSGKYNDKFVTVSDEDFEWLNQYKWFYNKGYACRWTPKLLKNGKKKYLIVYMHREIYEKHFNKVPKDFIVDHINRDRSNNEINNLRIITKQQNTWNRSADKDNKAGHKGICYCRKVDNRHIHKHVYEYWEAYIYKDKKQYKKHFPYTDEGLQQAIEWRRQKEKELFTFF